MEQTQANQALRNLNRGEPGASRALLEITCHEGYRRVGGDEVELARVYRTMLEHVEEARPSTRFWDWFDQIAKARKAPRVATPPPDLAERLAPALEGVSKSPSGHSLANRLTRMGQSGWLPCFATTLGVTGVMSWDPADGPASLAVALLVSLLVSSLFALAAGPWGRSWRRSLTRRHFLVRSAARCLLLVFWFPLLLTWVYWLKDRSIREGLDGGGKLFQDLWAMALDTAFDDFTVAAIVAGWLLGLLGCYGARRLTLRNPWVLYHGASGWRKVMGGVLLAPVLLLACGALTLLVLGARPDPALVELAKAPRSTQSPRQDLPPDLLAYARMDNKNFYGSDDKELRTRWLAEAVPRWSGDKPWEDKTLRAIAGLLPPPPLPKTGPVPLDLLRQTLLAACVDPDNSSVETLPEILSQLTYSADEWQRLRDLVLVRSDLARGARPSAENSWQLRKLSEDLAWPAESESLTLFGENAFQLAFHCYAANEMMEAIRNTPDPLHPLSRTEVDAAFSGDSANLQQSIKTGIDFFRDQSERPRRRLVYVLMLLELQRMRAAGEPLPTGLSSLSRPVRDIVAAYSTWFTLESSKGIVTVNSDSLSRTYFSGGPITLRWR